MAAGQNGVDSLRVARAAGVSRSTVSRVLNQPEIVHPDTRERVIEAIRQFGYTPKLSGQLLTGKRSKTIGLFICNAGTAKAPNLPDAHMDYILRCILSHAAVQGFHTLVNLVGDQRDAKAGDRIVEMFKQARVEGGLFVGFPEDHPVIERLVRDGECVGVFDSSAEDKTEPNRIIVNFDDQVGESAVDYLVSLGHRNIAAIHGDLNRYNGRQKYDGYLRGMRKHSLRVREEWMLYSDFHADVAEQQVRKMLRASDELPTAIFATNDSIAFTAVETLISAGVTVPDDVSVIGADDSLISQYYRPPLTTFRIDFREMLAVLTGKVIEYTEAPFKRQFVGTFGASLVERASCQPPRVADGT